ncbi:MAG: glucosamine inositolphosphorylceramide transferase family protein [bacterium]
MTHSITRRSNIHLSRIIIISILICLISLIFGIYIGKTKDIPFFYKKDYIWSVGIFMGDSPLKLTHPKNLKNPVLTARNITDVQADFIADPFMVKEHDTWYMFFEVLNKRLTQGDIGLAVSKDGLKWTYKKIILDEPFHLSYPYIFKWKNEYFMIPETTEANEVRLYKALEFPIKWTFVKTLLKGNFADPSIFHFNNKWWMFVEANPKGHDTLCIYYAHNLTGPWYEHHRNPVIKGDANIARPGGRIIIFDGRIIRFAQDDYPIYGNAVRAFEVTVLTPEEYIEKEVYSSPILKASGSGWNKKGMHHIDPHQLNNGKWIACVDGFTESLVFRTHFKLDKSFGSFVKKLKQ